jgi:adhesin transport system membrane fusion protein
MRFWWWAQKAPEQFKRIAGFTIDPKDELSGIRRIVYVSVAGLIFFFVWAAWAEIDQITRAPGSVIASSRTQLIQSLEGGTIEAILVKEGDVVDADQVLVRLETTSAETSYLQARVKVAGLMATSARLEAEIFGGSPQWPEIVNEYPEFLRNQIDLFRKRQSAIAQEVKALEDVLKLVREELNMLTPLLETGDVSRTEVLRLQRQEADVTAQITNRRNRYFQDAQAELGRAQEELAGVEQIMTQRKRQLENTILRAPLKGVVKNIKVSTVGGVLRPGEEVMQIVPLDDDLVIEAKLNPADIGFVKPGLVANIKIDAYDPSVYGSLTGELFFISPDTLTEDLGRGEKPYYRVRVRTTDKRFSARPEETLDIQPGMTAMVEIKTGSKSVLKYFTKPITKTLDNALGER